MSRDLPIAMIRVRGGSVPAPRTLQERLSFLTRDGYDMEMDPSGNSVWVYEGLFDPRQGRAVRNPRGLYLQLPMSTSVVLYGYWVPEAGGFALTAEPPTPPRPLGKARGHQADDGA